MKDFKGKVTDTSYLKNPQGTWQNAKNLLFTKQFNSPLNENGTKYIHLVRGAVCGMIDTNTEIVYFSIIDNNTTYNSLISVYSLDTEEIVEVIKGNFNFNRPIEGVYKYDYKGSLIVAWCDGVFDDSNPMKIAKVTNVDLPLVNGVLEDSKIKLIDLFPNINKGEVLAETAEGDVTGIYAYATFKYGYKEEETVFKDINTYCLLSTNDGNSSNFKTNGIKLTFTNLDYLTYDYIRIGLYIIGEESNNSYITKRINIESTDLEYNIGSLINLETISNAELIVPKERFIKGETMTQFESTLLIGQVKKEEEFKFQKYISMLWLTPDADSTPFNGQGSLPKFLQYNEVYNFHIQFDLKNGETSDWFHIPNVPPSAYDLLPAWDTLQLTKYKLDKNQFTEGQGYESFVLENSGTETTFGTWLNKETYPNEDEYNGTVDYDGSPLNGLDLRGQRVRFHRVMEEEVNAVSEDLFDPRLRTKRIVGVKVNGYENLPSNVRNQIQSARVGFSKRNYGNSLVVTNALAVPAADTKNPGYADYNEAFPVLNRVPTMPFNTDVERQTLVGDRVAAVNGFGPYGFSFNRVLLFSPELELLKPKLNFNVTVFNDVIFTGGVAFPFNNSELSDRETIDNGDSATIKDYNKYWAGFEEYAYKLPNNLEQGTRYLDGGLFVQLYQGNTHIKLGTSVGGGVLPHTKNSAIGSFPDADKIMGLSEYCTFSMAKVQLLNVQDNLYSLKDKEIVSSINTKNTYPTGTFYLGDVSVSHVKGQVAYRQGQFGADYSVFPIDTHTISPLSSSVMELKNNSIYAPIAYDDTENLDLYSLGYDVNASLNYSSLNDLAGYQGFDYLKPFITTFPDRIIRSAPIPDEGYIINNFRLFYVDAYYEVKSGKGDIVALRANDTYLFIQLRFALLLAEVKDVLRTKDVDAYLQTTDIFDRTPRVLTLDPKGYIGSDHKFACVITKEGYVVVDHRQGNIIIAKPALTIISTIGVRNEFLDNLEFEKEYIEVVNGIKKYQDNPYKYIGFSIGVDEEYNRLYVCKLYPPTLGGVPKRKEYYQEVFNKEAPPVNIPVLIDNTKNFTLSFSLDTNIWLCNHDFSASMFIGFKKRLFALKNVPYGTSELDTGILHAMNRGLKGSYFGVHKESYIDLIFNVQPETSKSLYMIKLITESFLNAGINTSVEQKTISKIVIFNDTQCSGVIVLDKNNKDMIRLNEGGYQINNFRDILNNPDLPILDDKGEIIDSNLNYDKNWFDKSYFIGKFIVIRLIWDNIAQDDIYINEVNPYSQISKR